jgi:phage tail-like protein
MPNVVAGDKVDNFLVGSWFDLELPKLTITGITEITGLGIELNVTEITVAGKSGLTVTKKMPGATKYGEFSIKRPLTPDKSLWNWIKDIRDGKNDYRVDGSIVMYDNAETEVGRWTFTNAWPTKWSASDLDAGNDDVMIEEATLAIEFFERVS